jgi:uncharacterized protein YfaS (alpha-2-macroglobulin family)
LLQRHFAPLARKLTPVAAEALLEPLREQDYNTLQSGLGVLALEAYARPGDASTRPTLLAAGKDGKQHVFGAPIGELVRGDLAYADTRAWVRPGAGAPAWYVLNESGFDRVPPKQAQANGLEVVRDYLDDKGQPVTSLKQGQEVTVRLRVRATQDGAFGPVAIVDLLPGGFEAVMQTPAPAPVVAEEGEDDSECEEEDCEGDGGDAGEAPPIPVLALPDSTLPTEHVEVREDRIVVYAYATSGVSEFKYRVRADNVGTFVVAPIFGEAMYRPRIYAQGGPAGTLTVTSPPPP